MLARLGVVALSILALLWPASTIWAKEPDEAPLVENHWSFQPIERPPVPTVRDTSWVRNSIDPFVLNPLEARGISPSPETAPRTLIRRLYLDLLGLAPEPWEVAAFVNDTTPYAYERLVNRLLASPHFGERWGRYWLDLARYADSDGYEKDTVRPNAWRYRHWVIDALNRDLPYDQFLIEQVAGDLLPSPGLEQLVATGFHRNTLTNLEGGVDQEEYRIAQVVDRVNTTSSVFMGLTMACAQCHDHKYDPLSQREYYGLFAFFNTAMEKDIEAPLDSERALYQRRLSDHENKRVGLQRTVDSYKEKIEERLEEWEKELAQDLAGVSWTLLEPVRMSSESGATLTRLKDGSILAGGVNPLVDTYILEMPTELQGITAFRLEVITDSSLPRTGPGRARHGNFILSEFTVETASSADPHKREAVAFSEAWADFWEKGFPASEAIDGDTSNGWSIDAWRGFNEDRTAIFITEDRLDHEEGTALTITLDHQYGTSHIIGRFRLYAGTGSRDYLLIPPEIPEILSLKSEDRTEKQANALLAYVGTRDPQMSAKLAALEGHTKNRPILSTTRAQIIANNPAPPETYIHERGDFLRQGERVVPHTPAVLPELRCESGIPSRLDLAYWLVSPEHPLTSRVAVNRIWEHLFGRGLVLSSEDFGVRGQAPSHPELLDWLAAEYMARGWSTKDLVKLIVSSATYRQSSRFRAELAAIDPDNALLTRQNRFRVEAEIIRDLMLDVSGLLNPVVGGPSVRPPLPKGIAELGYNNSIKWPESEGADKYRRGIYILFQRTVPYPMLMTFDCPDSNVAAIRRARSNTPLQALSLMNDPVFFEGAQALGARLYTEGPPDVRDRIRHAFRLCLGRDPDFEELSAVHDLWQDQRETFHLDKASGVAARVAGEYLPEGADPANVAPWIIVARTLMNLDEFITRE